MDWLNGFDSRVDVDVPLSEHTWFGLGGTAARMVSPRDESQLAALVQQARARGVPVRVLGSGANVLVSDAGVDGVVVRLSEPAFTMVDFDGDVATAGGGADLMKLCGACVDRGLSGLECMAGIPGTVGGAIRMNAGGRFGEISDCLEDARVMQPTGAVEVLARDRIGFGYRHSDLGRAIVLSARFRLRRCRADDVRARFREYWRFKKSSQPMAERSAGCIFKNPPGDSAGRLIDRAGLKGRSRGLARVSERHANFIVAEHGATATDVLELVDEIRGAVQEKFGIRLDLEIEVWQPDAARSCTV